MAAEPVPVCARPPSWVEGAGYGVFERLARWAQRAEELGIDGFFMGDRLLSEATDSGGDAVYAASMPEVTTSLAGVAARTERLLIGPLVLVFPYRHPLQLAKTIAGLDVVAGGRVVLGSGIGWNRKEFAALGIDRRRRGEIFEASLAVVRALWRGESVTDATPWWTLEDAAISPLPVRDGGPPIWLASFSPDSTLGWDELPPVAERVLDRVGRVADGWVPMVYSAASRRRLGARLLGQGWERVLESAGRAGRARSDIDFVLSDWVYVLDGSGSEARCREALARFFTGDWDEARSTYTIGTADEVVERLLADVEPIDRVDSFILTPLSDDLDQLELIAERIAPALREASR